MRSKSNIIGSMAIATAVLTGLTCRTLRGEVPVRNHGRAPNHAPIHKLSNEETTCRLQPKLQDGNARLEWQPRGVTIQDGDNLDELDVTTLTGRVDTSSSFSDQSGVVAHIVRRHQVQMHNLITLTSDKTRMALFDEVKKGLTWDEAAAQAKKQFAEPAKDLLRYLLFTHEPELSDSIQDTSGFQKVFEQLGPFDHTGRTLRDLDLQTRIFRYPCSYLIYSDEWDAVPEPAKGYLYHRLHEVLTGEDQSPEFSRLTSETRQAILEILLDTEPDLPAEWKQSRRQKAHAKAELARIRTTLAIN